MKNKIFARFRALLPASAKRGQDRPCGRLMARALLLAALLPATAGCSKWLDVQPYDKISEEELLSSDEGFRKLLNGIYIELNSDALYGGALGVEMVEVLGGAYEIGDVSSVWGNYIDLKNYDFNTEYWRSRLDGCWNKAYSLILNCNKLLTNIEGKGSLFAGYEYDIIRGEALALRALLHFDMLRLFGPVYSLNPEAYSIPYYTAERVTPEPLLPAREVIGRVRSDLSEARKLLLHDPVLTEGTLMSGDPGGDNSLRYRALRLNYYAVTALLARVELYAGQKSEALKCASEVIRASDSGIFPFVDRSLVVGNPDDPDRIFSSEVLFALSHANRNNLFVNYFSPARTTFVFKMENDLMEQVIYGGGSTTGGYQDDYRNRVGWSSSGANRYFYKYADMAEPGRIENTMIPMLRLGEMFLIAAECVSDDLTAGTSYVNALRSNRGISSRIEKLTPELLKYEYIRELYGEGQLFFLYKRLFSKVIRSATDSRNPEPSNNLFVVPLPDSETENRQ